MEQEFTFVEDSNQTYTVHFQNKLSYEQILILYRNGLNDFIHKKVLEDNQNKE